MKRLFGFSLRLVALFLALYPLILRRIISYWGANELEVESNLLGDELVPNPVVSYTRAISIKAKAEEIFPWLLQIGQGRGGFYSYEFLENLFGMEIYNADEIVPDYQALKLGDTIRMSPYDIPSYKVVDIQPNKALLLQSNTPEGETTIGSWLFFIETLDDETCRLVIRSRLSYEENVLNFIIWRVLVEPIHFIMEERMLRGIKERAETKQVATPLVTSPA